MSLGVKAALHLIELRHDDLAPQRALIAATHQIFPTLVAYADAVGMVAASRKINIFMSSGDTLTVTQNSLRFVASAQTAHANGRCRLVIASAGPPAPDPPLSNAIFRGL